MVKNIYSVWKINKNELFLMLGSLLVCGVLGMIVMTIVLHIDTEEPFITLGSLIAIVVWGMVNFILGLLGYQNTFDLIVSMGCRRKDFITSQIVVVYINMLLECGMLVLIYGIEKLLHRFVFSSHEMEMITTYILKPKILLMLLMIFPALRLLMGALLLRYKKKAFWIIWAIWVFGTYGSGRMISYLAHHPQNPIMAGITALGSMPDMLQMLLVVLITAGMLAGTYLFTRKQAVYV